MTVPEVIWADSEPGWSEATGTERGISALRPAVPANGYVPARWTPGKPSPSEATA